jgi:hypothetical protein
MHFLPTNVCMDEIYIYKFITSWSFNSKSQRNEIQRLDGV